MPRHSEAYRKRYQKLQKKLQSERRWDETERRWEIERAERDRKAAEQLGSSDRFVVRGPASWPSSFHTAKRDAIAKAQACSKKHPNAICKVTQGLPGMQKTIAECNRNECWTVSGSVGKRRRKKARRK